MTRPRIDAFAENLANKLGDHERRLRGIENQSSLAYSSLEDGALDENDRDGNLVGQIGKQFDGSHMYNSIQGPKPPQPSAPIVTGGPGSLTIVVDGTFAAGEATILPFDFTRWEVHVSNVAEFETVSAANLAGSLESPRGGTLTLAPAAGTWYVSVRARSLAGKSSDPSPVASAAVTLPADQVAVDEAFAARDAVIDRHAIDISNNVTELNSAKTRLGTAETKLTTAQTDITNTQGTVSGLSTQLDTNTTELGTAKTDIANHKVTLNETFPARFTATEQATATAQTKANKAESDAAAARARADALILSGQSIVPDGGFESTDTGMWTMSGSTIGASTTARSGSRSTKLTPATASAYTRSNYVPSATGRTFYVEAYVRKTGTAGGDVGIQVQSFTESGGFSSPIVGQVAASTLPVGSYTKVWGTYTIPAGVLAKQTRFGPFATTSSNTYEFDDLLIVDVTEAETARLAAATAQQEAEDAAAAAVVADGKAVAAAGAASTAQGAADAAKAVADVALRSAVKTYHRSGDSAIGIWGSSAKTPVAWTVVDSAGSPGGKALLKDGTGKQSGYDSSGMQDFDPAALYRITFKLRATRDATNVAGVLYAGALGFKADGVTSVSTNGTESFSSAHYFAASNVAVTVAQGWRTFIGYFRGNSSALAPSPSITAPGRFHPDVRKFMPMLFMDYNNGDGAWELGSIDVDVIPAEAEKALIDAKTAQDRADAAHTLAGTAVDNAATAQASANGKNMLTKSTSPPAGDGLAIGDTHYMFADQSWAVETGRWTWNGIGPSGGWLPAKIGHQVLDSVDIGSLSVIGQSKLSSVVAENMAVDIGTFIELNVEQLKVTGTGRFSTAVADRMFADIMTTNKVLTQHLAVTDLTDFAPNWVDAPGDWTLAGFTFATSSYGDLGSRLSTNLKSGTAVAYGPYKQVAAGQKLYAEATTIGPNTGQAFYLRYYWYDKSKTYMSYATHPNVSASGTKMVLDGAVVPAGAVYARLCVLIVPGPDNTECGFYNIKGYKQAGATLIEPNGIKSPNIDVTSTLTARIGAIIDLDVTRLVVTETSNLSDVVAERIAAKTGIYTKLYATQVVIGEGGNVIPNGSGSLARPAGWSANLTMDTVDHPAGIEAAFKCAAGAGTLQGDGSAWFSVEPNAEYIWEIWMKADKPNSKFYLELRDQANALQGGITAISGQNYAGGGNYQVNNFTLPTVWTKYSHTITTSATAEKLRVGGLYFNHPNGTERTAVVSLAGLSMRSKITPLLAVDGLIDGKVVTGATVRTKSSGARFELNGTTNRLTGHRTNGTEWLSFEDVTGMVLSGEVDLRDAGGTSLLKTAAGGLTLKGDITKEGTGTGGVPLSYMLGTYPGAGVERLGLTFNKLSDPLVGGDQPAQVVSYDGNSVTINSRNYGDGRRGQISVEPFSNHGRVRVEAVQGNITLDASLGSLDALGNSFSINGVNLLSNPSNVTFVNSWANFSSTYDSLTSKQIMPKTIVLNGVIRRTISTAGVTQMHVATLVSAHRPSKNIIQSCILRCAASPTYRPGMLGIFTTGEVWVYGGMDDLSYAGIQATYFIT